MDKIVELMAAINGLILLWFFFVLPLALLLMIFMTPKLDRFMSDNPKFESQWFVNRFTRFNRYGVVLIFDSKRYKCPTGLRWLVVLSTLMSFVFLAACFATLLL